ncbi:MAG: hypothetical protein A3F84_04885 [Candidatus Handelsmanbacteria bacterium RIFCSPLOWO2_12_FULL_64_10]|uniref:Amidohydrolase-related domain-containing protein n=1 Tax=Handelsmanbacteria sp. (strain RIFCSPLOWO2_12_FULL_64_10) TaxID=1817868 RepID=A0A1F6CY06_HANXR|nr:MAG: hypothetical protein A3F84_04885 [Candidatus Handelsmanbacteria bacterium RIFCSPLOWO2_12_FULL_64_10]
MIDINAGCGDWPFWPTRAHDAASLEELLRAEGIERACAYPLEAYLWPDPQEANELRLPELVKSPFFVPSAVLNPTFPNALRCYEACRRGWNVPMIRLIPSYHLYELSHEGVGALAGRAEEDGVILGVHLQAEDKRNRNPIVIELSEVPFGDAVALARRHPKLTVVAFGLARIGDVQTAGLLPEGYVGRLPTMKEVEHRADIPENLFVELSFFELEDSFNTALKLFRPEQLLMGTHAPIFYPRAAPLKIQRSTAPEAAKSAALAGNARRLLGLA